MADTNPAKNVTPFPRETDSQEFPHPEELDLPKPSPDPMPKSTYEPYEQPSHIEPPPQCYPKFSKPPKSSLSRIHLSPSTGKTPRGEKEAVAELLAILVDCMQELNTRSRESLLRKFFSEVERDERLEKFIVERLRQSKVKAISDLFERLPDSVRGQIGDYDGGNYVSVGVESGNDSDISSPSNDESEIPKYYDVVSESVEIYDTSSSTTERSLIESVEDLSQELERFKIRTLDVGGVGKEEEKK